MTDHGVIIAGGGPSGLMLAAELALAGVDVAIVERRPSQDVAGSRAGGLHSRTLEVFDQRGIADRFLAEGQKAQATGFAGVHFDLSGFPTRHPYSLGKRCPYFVFKVADTAARAFSEKAESEGDSHAGTNMIQASCWEEASMDGEAVFGGLACTRNRRG